MKLVMEEDSAAAQLYQETVAQIKRDKEVDYDRIQAVHDRFDYFKDKDKMEKKIKDKRYDITGHPSDTSDDLFTTELSDEADNHIYRQYKLHHYEAKREHHELANKVEELKHAIRESSNRQGRDANTRPVKAIIDELTTKKFKQKRRIMKVEQYLSAVRMMSHISRMSRYDVLVDEEGNRDPLIDQYWDPYTKANREAIDDPSLLPEIRKMLNDTRPEVQDAARPITSAEDRQEYMELDEINQAYFDAKWKWYIDKKMSQMKLSMKDIEEAKFHAEQYDPWIEKRVDFMYNYLDYDNDRRYLREKFAHEMHKKTTLKDVGEKLDEFILESKARTMDYWDPAKHILEQPDKATKDIDAAEFDWKERMLQSFEPIKPAWADDKSSLNELSKDEKETMEEIHDRVEFEDKMRDHSKDNLTPEEHKEIALFHSAKQDPFYKHHLRTFLSEHAEAYSEHSVSPLGPHQQDPSDFARFDRINLFDFRRTLPR